MNKKATMEKFNTEAVSGTLDNLAQRGQYNGPRPKNRRRV